MDVFHRTQELVRNSGGKRAISVRATEGLLYIDFICLFKFRVNHLERSGPEVIKLFPCSTQLSMKFFLLMNVKMPTVVGILTFMRVKNSILCLSEPRNSRIS